MKPLRILNQVLCIILVFKKEKKKEKKMVVYTGARCAAWMVVLLYAGCVHGQSPCKLTDVPLKEGFDINRVSQCMPFWSVDIS